MGQVTLARVAKDHLRDGGIDYPNYRYPREAPHAWKRIRFDGECRPRRVCEGRRVELPRKFRINAVSPPWVKETMLKLGIALNQRC